MCGVFSFIDHRRTLIKDWPKEMEFLVQLIQRCENIKGEIERLKWRSFKHKVC